MSPYYADPALPAGRRWVNPDICRTCDDPKPVAARQGVPHPLGEHLCLDHLLGALGVAAEKPLISAPDVAGPVRAAFRASLRVGAERPDPTTAATLARQAPPQPLEPEVLAAAALTMSELGAVPLRTERTFGVPAFMGCAWKPSEAAREYDPGTPVAYKIWSAGHEDPGDDGVKTYAPPRLLEPDHEDVPKAARTLARAALKAGWGVRILAGRDGLIAKVERPGQLILVRYANGCQAAAWLKAVGGPPIKLDAKQVGGLIRAGA